MRKFLIIVACLLVSTPLLLSACNSTPATTSVQTTNPPPSTSVIAAPPPTTTQSTTPPPTQKATPPPSDTTPPPAITGLIAHNAYDGKVNLWWDKSTATDFGHYNIYVNKTEFNDVTGMEPALEANDISGLNYQISGLDDDTGYHFAVTAVDKSGNEDTHVTTHSAMPAAMARGTADPVIMVDINLSEKAWAGTTLLPDNYDAANPRIIEVNMWGEIIWQYDLPANLKKYTNPGFDLELLENNNILIVLPGSGVYEIDRSGKIVWSYIDAKVSHDADRLPDGNTIVVFGNNDQKSDAQVKEVDPSGKPVWLWSAGSYFDKAPYDTIFNQGWTHTNAVSRLANGNTLISPRNFNLLVEVAPDGEVVKTYGEGLFEAQHDPAILANGNILLCNHGKPNKAIEYDPMSGKVVWQSPPFDMNNSPIRDANRLPNGNILITGTIAIVEITPEGQTVWEMKLKDITFPSSLEAAARGFYKAERISSQD